MTDSVTEMLVKSFLVRHSSRGRTGAVVRASDLTCVAQLLLSVITLIRIAAIKLNSYNTSTKKNNLHAKNTMQPFEVF